MVQQFAVLQFLINASSARQKPDPDESQIDEVVNHLNDFKQAVINSNSLKSQLAQSSNFFIFNFKFDAMVLL
jgi:hypothetical protein